MQWYVSTSCKRSNCWAEEIGERHFDKEWTVWSKQRNAKKKKKRQSTLCFGFSLFTCQTIPQGHTHCWFRGCRPSRNPASVGHHGQGWPCPPLAGEARLCLESCYVNSRGGLLLFLDLSQKKTTKSANFQFRILPNFVILWVWVIKAAERCPEFYNDLLISFLLLFSVLQSLCTCQTSVDFPGKLAMTSTWPKKHWNKNVAHCHKQSFRLQISENFAPISVAFYK